MEQERLPKPAGGITSNLL